MTNDAAPAASFRIGGDLEVHRLGFGAMRLTGEGIWGEPNDVGAAKRVLQLALELGIDLIDTADSYGPDVSERLIGETLAPYPGGVVIATKGGLLRPGPGKWERCGRPEHLREALEGSLQRLRLDCIPLYQLHAIDDGVPLEDQVGTLAEMQKQGKIRHVGLSNVDTNQLAAARREVEVVSVQNRFNLTDRAHEPVLEECERLGIGFIPWFPLATGDLAKRQSALTEIAERHDAAPAQVALAWLLHRSPVMLPIPGTSSEQHLRENVGARELRLSADEMKALDAL